MRRLLAAAALLLVACGPAPDDSIVDVGNGRPGGPARIAPADLPAFFDCLRERGATLVSAHRGGPRPGLSENAIETFEATLAETPAFMETDVSRTRDGALVLMHDDTVDRTTNGHGAVSALTLAQFQALRLRDSHGTVLETSPPSLEQALAWADGKTVLELDIKRSVAYEDAVRAVEDAGAMHRVVFVTYSIDGAARLARLAPGAMIYTSISSPRELDVLARRGVDLSRIVAWVGTDAPGGALVQALAERGVETRFGMFGANRDYANALRARAQMVAVDDPAEAGRDLDAADGAQGHAALQCVR